METRETIYRSMILVTIIVSSFLLALAYFKGCNNLPQQHREALQNKITTLKAKVDTFKVHDSILVTKWKQSKAKTDTIYKWVVINAPDTCQMYIDTLAKVYDNERELASKTIDNKDSIIVSQSEIIKANEMIIAYSDSVAKSRSHKYLRGLRDGLVIGAGAGFVISKIVK